MQAQTGVTPWWATLTVWGVVNTVNILQAAGFLSRVSTGSMTVNHHQPCHPVDGCPNCIRSCGGRMAILDRSCCLSSVRGNDDHRGLRMAG